LSRGLEHGKKAISPQACRRDKGEGTVTGPEREIKAKTDEKPTDVPPIESATGIEGEEATTLRKEKRMEIGGAFNVVDTPIQRLAGTNSDLNAEATGGCT